ncbi:MAG: sigma 54-interacting transcriptional regulator [Ignavibacteriales bacterium]|nr:sigma 54-interacting transcriptional regulator [Ignavibacteriales bacterium]
MSKRLLIPGGCLVAVGLMLVLLAGPIQGLEERVLTSRYAIRGEIQADTNLVILYFDNDDIASLGGWPLTRNYYALLIDVLTRSRVVAVGFDILFGEHNLQFPEHDNLLALTTAASGKVVLSSYFRVLPSESSPQNSPDVRISFLPSLPGSRSGTGLQLPFTELASAASGIGHANLVDGAMGAVPLFVRSGPGAVPFFGLEVLRVALGVDRDEVRVEGGKMSLARSQALYQIPFDEHGTSLLNFPGPISVFKRYRCIEVLRSYELQRMGLNPTLDLTSLEGKIILVGVIGEGRSIVVQSPFDRRFPSIGVQATFLDNALTGRFLSAPGSIVSIPLSLLLVGFALWLFGRLRFLTSFTITAFMLLVYGVVTQWTFVSWGIVLPLAGPVLSFLLFATGAVLYEYGMVRKTVGRLETDKQKAESELRARELKLQALERELLDRRSRAGGESRPGDLEEIQRYKEEIRTLSARVSDLVKFEPIAENDTGGGVFEGMVYQASGRMKETVELIQKISTSDANVLVLGESGTGKELVAQAIHHLSPRGKRQFVTVNCGALTETLLESELFGHEKGSFTGAVKDKMGRFEFADGGTIFLDEIAETSEAFQVKLLRVVQSGEFERVGSTMTLKVDARIIAATNKSLKDLVQEKRFREDLYYRLNVFSVQLPALRERKADIPLLAQHFVTLEDPSFAISSTVLDAYLQYPWPGNVRELQGSIKRAAILAKSEKRSLIQLKDLSEEIISSLKGQVDIEDQILELLRNKKFSRSSISETAEELGGLNRGTVAEYFRGICFKYFFESVWDKELTIAGIAGNQNGEANERVMKKLSEYVGNVVEGVQQGRSLEDVKPSLKAKYKNLPQRYHTILDEVIRAYLDGKWR